MADVFTCASKEFSDIVRSRRFIVLIVVFGLIMIIPVITIYVQVSKETPSHPRAPMPQKFLGVMAYTLSGTLSLFASVMGLALGYDAISGERENGTLKTILAQPIFRETVINGKFLAAASAVFLAILITSTATVGASTIIIGVTPTPEETLRMALFLIISIIFTMTYFSISTFFSTVLKKTSHSIIVSVTLWAMFQFVIPVIALLIALTIATPDAPEFIATAETISSLSPEYHFTKIGEYLLALYAVEGLSISQQPRNGASITSSLMYAGPNILVLVIVTFLFFTFAYMTFTRQEIR